MCSTYQIRGAMEGVVRGPEEGPTPASRACNEASKLIASHNKNVITNKNKYVLQSTSACLFRNPATNKANLFLNKDIHNKNLHLIN